MSRLPALFIDIVDSTGSPVSGGKAFFYETDTTNLLTTYSDPAKAVANTNPIISGADGKIGPVYMQDNTAYTVVEKDASDVTLRTQDGVYSVLLSSTVLDKFAVSPLDYGAVADGVTDDASAIQQAVTAAGEGGVVDLGGRIYKCDSTISFANNRVTFGNGKLDGTDCPTEFLKASGSLGANNTLTANAAAGDTLVSLTNVTGLSIGDLLNIQDSDTVPGTNSTNGEIVEISSVSSLDANLQAPLFGDYATATSAIANKITAVEDLHLHDLQIIGGADETISLVNCRRAKVQNVHCVSNSSDPVLMISGCNIVDVKNLNILGKSGEDEGIIIAQASQHVTIEDYYTTAIGPTVYVSSNFSIQKTGSAKGLQRYINVSRMRTDYLADASSTTGVFLDASAQYVTFDNAIIRVEDEGTGYNAFTVNSYSTELRSCEVYAIGDAGTILPITASQSSVNFTSVNKHYLKLVNCKLFAAEDFSLQLGAPNMDFVLLDNVECTGGGRLTINTLTGLSAVPELQIRGGLYKDLTITGGSGRTFQKVKISNTSIDGILICTLADELALSNVRADEIDLTSVLDLNISDVKIDQSAISGDAALSVDNSGITTVSAFITSSLIKANVADKSAVYMSDMNNLFISNCKLEMTSGVGFYPLELAGNCQKVFINNNLFQRLNIGDFGLVIEEVVNGIVDNNIFSNGAVTVTGTNFSLAVGTNNMYSNTLNTLPRLDGTVDRNPAIYTLHLSNARVWDDFTSFLPLAAASDDLGFFGSPPIHLRSLDSNGISTIGEASIPFSLPHEEISLIDTSTFLDVEFLVDVAVTRLANTSAELDSIVYMKTETLSTITADTSAPTGANFADITTVTLAHTIPAGAFHHTEFVLRLRAHIDDTGGSGPIFMTIYRVRVSYNNTFD
jgi:polygalacturonase